MKFDGGGAWMFIRNDDDATNQWIIWHPFQLMGADTMQQPELRNGMIPKRALTRYHWG